MYTMFLSEVIAAESKKLLEPFTECIILSTICGRILAHQQQLIVEREYSDLLQGCWSRHKWLDALLSQRVRVLSFEVAAAERIDPLLCFSRFLAQTAVIYLCDIASTLPNDQSLALLEEYGSLAFSAAQDIVTSLSLLDRLTLFKES
ncbi:hypothetical protein F5884DRAFT_350761 [Xylogone sp. PMI_703]|nr:hypothetical protein F5884DRAFT_350761 [Xylogone sp. PMI_703]